MTCDTITDIAKTTKQHFRPIADELVPVLMTLTYVTVKVISDAGNLSILDLIQHSRYDINLTLQALSRGKNGVLVCAALI